MINELLGKLIVDTLIENKLIVLSALGVFITYLLRYWVKKGAHSIKGFVKFMLGKKDEPKD